MQNRKNIFSGGAQPPPQAPPPMGRRIPPPTPYPFGAFGSIIALSPLDLGNLCSSDFLFGKPLPLTFLDQNKLVFRTHGGTVLCEVW